MVAPAIGAIAFGPGGSVYVVVEKSDGGASDLVILDRDGSVTGTVPLVIRAGERIHGPLAVDGEGRVYLTSCDSAGCWLSRRKAGSVEEDAWVQPEDWTVPVIGAISGGVDQACSGPALGRDGTVYAACSQARESGSVGGRTIAVAPSGEVRDGWPVGVAGDRLTVADDGTVYVGSSERRGWSEGETTHPLTVTAIDPSGSIRPGWPVSFPTADAGYVVAPDGIVRAWWRPGGGLVGECVYESRATVYTTVGRDGRTLPGWPVRVPGAASEGAVSADGTLYFVDLGGDVHARDRAGRERPGWPVADAGVGRSCGPALAPDVAPDGALHLVDADTIVVLTPEGRPADGWPIDSPGWMGYCTTPSGDTGRPPLLGAAGSMYVLFDCDPTRLAGYDRTGRPLAGWPQPVGRLLGAAMDPAGRPIVISVGHLGTTPSLDVACLQPLDPAKALPYLGCDFDLVLAPAVSPAP